MCGLTGVFGSDITLPQLQAFQKLAQMSSLRGEDSTGVFDYQDIKNQGSIYHKKTLQAADEYFSGRGDWEDDTLYGRYLQKKTWHFPSVVAAHARAATVGKVAQENAHPFKCGHILGMHNGTIHKHFEGRNAYQTDSEALFFLIAEKGEEAALDTLNTLHGAAFALTWINSKDHSFNICRNYQRPLFFVEHPIKDIVFYSSDKTFLDAVLPYFKMDGVAKPFYGEKHFKFKLKSKSIKGSVTQRALATRQEWYRQSNPLFDKPEAPKTVIHLPTTPVEKPLNDPLPSNMFKPYQAVHVVERSKDQGRKYDVVETKLRVGKDFTWSIPTYKKLLEKGCAGCNKRPFEFDPAHFFQDGQTFVCNECIKDNDIVQFVADETAQILADEFLTTSNTVSTH